jgi:hypothetical protein
MAVGCRGAYILRPGMVRNPLYRPPDLAAASLAEITALLIETT